MLDFLNKFRFGEYVYRGICLDEVEEIKKLNGVKDISELINKKIDFILEEDRGLISNPKKAASYSLSWYRSGLTISTRFNPLKFKYTSTHVSEGDRFYISNKKVMISVYLLDSRTLLTKEELEKDLKIAKISPNELGHEHRKYK